MGRARALVLLVAVLAAGGVWLAARDDGDERGRNLGPGTLPTAAHEESASPVLLTPTPLAPTERGSLPARKAPPRAPALDVEHQSFALAGARWLTVTVVLPEGVPRDDAPALIGFARKDGEAIDPWNTVRVSEALGLDDAFAQELGPTHHWSRRPLTTHVRLPFPPETREGLLFVQSRYLHLDPLTVTLAPDGVATIEPELGGYVSGHCVFPPGSRVAPADVVLELDGRPKRSRGETGGQRSAMILASPDSREVHPDEEHLFELRALSPSMKYGVLGKAAGFVDHFEPALEVEPGEHRVLAIRFRRGASVSGIVRGAGAPLAGARVRTDFDGERPWTDNQETRSDADGTFRLTRIPEGTAVLRTTLDGWLDAESDSLEFADEQVVEGIVLELAAGLRLSGTVRWPDGTPAEGAEVRVLGSRERWLQEEARVMSDSAGAFTAGGLQQPPFEVYASRERRSGDPRPVLPAGLGPAPASPLEVGSAWSALASGVVPGAAGLVLTLEPPLPVVGSVRDDTGAPLERFRVVAKPPGRPLNAPEERSFTFETATGDFTLGLPHSGVWGFVAEQDSKERRSAEVSLSIPQGRALVLVVPRGNNLGGRVVAPDGTPVEGAQIHVNDDPRQAAFGFFGLGHATSDSDGRFTLEDVTPGSSLHAAHADWADSEPLAAALGPGEERQHLLLVLRRGARITGEVFDQAGRPEPGRKVTVAHGARMALPLGFGGGTASVTDSAGRFVFEHVAPGKVTVAAVPGETRLMERLGGDDEAAFLALMSDVRSASVEVADGGEAHVVLGAKPRKPVRVQGLVSAAGIPLADEKVLALAEGGTLFQGVKLARTDAGGRYALELDRPGDYVFGVGQGAFGGAGTPFYVEVPETDRFELDLALPLGRIAGRVHGPAGPVAGVPLRLVSAAGALGLDDRSDSHRARTASDGSFGLEHLHPGTYALEVGSEFGGLPEPPRFGQVVVDGLRVEKDRALEGLVVRLEPPGTLAGLVRDADHAPVGGVAIFVRDAAGRAISSSDCVSDASGRFTYPGIAPGRASASAKGARLVSPESAAFEIRSGATTQLELVVVPGTFLRVALLDGEREVRARLRVVDARGRRVDGLLTMDDVASLLAEGSSSRAPRVGPLAAGTYTLTATALDGQEATQTLTVEAGQEERVVTLRLK